ncbi:MAG: polymer-forming cytoskeletal protein [Alphaproteobacteria bacterium]|jgi:cytoskeletal protein CcmA (bactofilin family)|nr:polymer-forming cytoskeletal protein [Alphaproteobacteria bacterium]
MFGRKQDGSDGDGTPPEEASEASESSTDSFAEGIRQDVERPRPEGRGAGEPEDTDLAPSEPTVKPGSTMAVLPPAGGAGRAAAYRTAPEPPEPAPETPAPPSAAEPTQPSGQAMTDDDTKKLIVGRGISLKGEISECDSLIVKGSVEVNLPDGHSITVGTTGVFKGSVEVEEATIAGQFEGTLVARKVLTIQSSGQVRGDIRYGGLQVEPGGVLSGTVDSAVSAPATPPAGADQGEPGGGA